MQRMFSWFSRRRWFVSIPLLLVAGIVAYLAIYSLLEWANSTEFCGTTCHVMDPEYTAYQSSFHSRVRCAECHVGPGLAAEVEAKWQGIRELWLNVTQTYEKPIPSPVESLRPAKDTCERCHWPEVFYNDRAVEIVHYAADENNTRSNTYMLVKIGGGTEREGQGRGIHWHIQNVIEYVALDPQRQEIPWVRADMDGELVTYVDVTSSFEAADLEQYEVRVMDCIDCHNRATHVFRSAEQAVTEAMANGVLPSDLPFLYEQAVERMGATYETQEQALAAIGTITEFYRQGYRGLYAERAKEIYAAAERLQEMYRSSHFPQAEVYPETYPNNVGHSEFPGCFRCHDGKHLAEDGSSIRLHCNICHTIPKTFAESEAVPDVPFQSPPQPANHLDSAWMADHRYIVDETCAGCHDMQTFCANPNCHGHSWPYVDLSVISPPFPLPTPVPVGPQPAATPLPTRTTEGTPSAAPSFSADILPMIESKCAVSCHSAASALGGFVAADYAGVTAAVVPGDASSSRLVQVQQGEHPAKLSPEELELLMHWIRAGAPDN
ncbi:MAG: NapC/NirT family cytochrome c [Chloroflexia bacterium]|nr:NapC/NirT family cytochrome c [Chloroflexia bacterium]